MSGGSFNYFFRQIDIDGQLNLEDLRAMRDRLRELAPDSAATAATSRLYDLIRSTGRDETLTDVWRAVEWEDSGDGYDGQVPDAVAAFEKANRTETDR